MTLMSLAGVLAVVALGSALLLWRRMPASGPRRPLVTILLLLAAAPFLVIWIIASSDRLFFRTVPLEQRLVSPHEGIRKRAEQDLLGLDTETRRGVAQHLIPYLDQEGDPFVR